ncbi:polysaccharide lyase family 8 super-sandwich domain-containing protein [Paenibacillus alba]|uniref:Polysaccharide lyase family 8 super-sandwich domain-containing protein n=1 Tax=Paenibacillus alba TaxID=1197127 RepID=A0ABU6GAW9_9BACL|nr:polysaccharide lyase family 8 super-sandwich domain-containing protein [Paenibacillus alba]MEC0230412.1 polysaccharide lyase family 8 super-sandwich domain-containing protein [Paenibacillus alba]
MSKLLRSVSLLCLCLVVVSVCAVGFSPRYAQASDEYDGLRMKLQRLLLGDGEYVVPVTDALLQTKISTMDSLISSCSAAQAPCTSGKGYWDLMNRSVDRTYLWVDMPFTSTDSFTKSGDISGSYGRLYAMIVGYYTPGSVMYQNAALKTDVINALDWLNVQKYNTTVATYGNWFHWQIGVPQILTKTVLLMKNELTPAQVTSYMDAVNRFIPNSAARTVSGSPVMTGANLLDQAIAVAYRGIIMKDSAKLADARDALSSVFAYVSPASAVNTSARDGFYADGSFIQHAAMPYIGGYGTSLLNDVGILLHILSGSSWDVTDTNKWHAYRWIFDSVEPFIYNGNVMDMVRGRNIAYGPALGLKDTDPILTAKGLMSSICYLLLTAPATNDQLGAAYPGNPKQAIQSMLKYWITQDLTNQILDAAPIYQYVQLKQIVADASIPSRGEKLGQFLFPNQDRALQLRPGYGFGISMSSKRVDKYESGNKNNVKGWYTGDGMTYLYNADKAQYENYWPTVNPYRLPGTTVDTQTRTTSSNWTNYMSPNNWTGGAELLGSYGAIGMDLKAPGDIGNGGAIVTPSNLTAKKSWFTFDNEIVALGAGITNTGQSGNGWDGTPRKVETIVDNRQISGSNAFTVNGSAQPTTLGWSSALSGTNWLHLQGNTGGNDASVGYYFPSGTTIQAKREARTGTWNEINQATANVYNLFNTEDSFVRQNEANHGTESTLLVKNDSGGYARESYLKFDVSAFVPDGVTFDTAKVTLVPTSVGTTANTIQHTAEWVADNSWTESGLLWTNKPSSVPLSPLQQWSGMQAGTPITIDVTKALQAALAGNQKVFSLRIMATSPVDANGWVYYASRENANAAYRPKLVLSNYKEQVAANYMTLWMNHGTNPSNAAYSYVMLPNMSSAQVQNYAANPTVAIVENTTSAQAVKETDLNLVAANVWQDGLKTIGDGNGGSLITVNKKSSLLVQEAGGLLDLAISDPTQANTGTIEVELNRSYANAIWLDTGITVTQYSPTLKLLVDVNGSYGKSFHAKFGNTAPIIISSSADAWVRDGSTGNTNYGTAGYMEVKNESVGYNRTAFVQFDLSSYSGTMTRAAILLSVGGTPSVDVRHQAKVVVQPWSENTLTWNNKPAASLPLAEWKVPAAGSYVWIDVTDQVRSALSSANKNVAIEVSSLTGGSATYVSYGSKENATAASRPVLRITP